MVVLRSFSPSLLLPFRGSFGLVSSLKAWILPYTLGISDSPSCLDSIDPYGCRALLNQGKWLDNSQFYQEPSLHNWQVPGCMIHDYDADDIIGCLAARKIALIGDSRVRDMFWALAKRLNYAAAAEKEELAQKHQSQSFSHADIVIDFIWDPYLNSTHLRKQLAVYQNPWDPAGESSKINRSPAILLIGGGLWHARHLGDTFFTEYKASIEQVIRHDSPGSSPRWTSLFAGRHWKTERPNDLMVLAPVQHLSNDSASPSVKQDITPDKVNKLNDYLLSLSLSNQASVALSFQRMTSGSNLALQEDGIHIDENVVNREIDILLNLRCNTRLLRSQVYPKDKTCCGLYAPPNWFQTLFVIVSSVILLYTILMEAYGAAAQLHICRKSLTWHTDFRWSLFAPSSKVLIITPSLALVLFYAFIADRTSLFNKVHKKHDAQDFAVMSLVVFGLGILSIRRCTKRMRNSTASPRQEPADQPILSREQTDEWKGWMQALILIYHYTGSSQILGIYKLIRLLVASYLFMTGFGHTMFFYHSNDYSLRRCAAVLLRLNFLSCLLPYVMGTDYLFYYFAPLITFWYLIIYLTMRIGHSRNSSSVFLVTKITISACIITLLIRVPQVLETVFAVLAHTCNIQWNVSEWRFRMQLDAYVVFVGMLCSIACEKGFAILYRVESESPEFLSAVCRFWILMHAGIIASALSGLHFYYRFAQGFSNKVDYNQWFPFVSWVPILSFVILRNCTRTLRNFRSSFFVWLGQHSLETFVLQFHIWLAADTKGILSLGIFGRRQTDIDGRWTDCVLLTIVFLWMSWRAAKVTTAITLWIVGPITVQDRGGERDRAIELPLRSHRARRDSSGEDQAPTQAQADQESGFLTRAWARLGDHVRHSLISRLTLMMGMMLILNWVSRVRGVLYEMLADRVYLKIY